MKQSYLVALGITGVAAIWLLSGQIGGSEAGDAGPAAPPPAAEAFAVRVAQLKAEPMVREVQINGRTVANRAVELRAEVAGLVEAVPVQKGAEVKEGDVIARVAVNARKADLARARATLTLRRTEFEAAQRLAEKGFNSTVRRNEAAANFEAAQAAMVAAELAFQKTEIKAPYDGVLDLRPVEVGDFVDPGDPVATVVDLDPIKLVASVTERNVQQIQVGGIAHARLFEGGEVEGKITYIASQADPQARTFQVEVEVPNPERKIVAGLTVAMRLPVAQKLAHQISPAALTLDDAGAIGVMTVDAAGKVAFVPVSLVGDAPRGVWVSGLPETANVVVVGQEFIVPGETVKAVPVQEGQS